MAVPKKKRSKSKSRIKRSYFKAQMPNLRACPNCGELGVPHRACMNCGTYKGKQVVQIKIKEPKAQEE